MRSFPEKIVFLIRYFLAENYRYTVVETEDKEAVPTNPVRWQRPWFMVLIARACLLVYCRRNGKSH